VFGRKPKPKAKCQNCGIEAERSKFDLLIGPNGITPHPWCKVCVRTADAKTAAAEAAQERDRRQRERAARHAAALEAAEDARWQRELRAAEAERLAEEQRQLLESGDDGEGILELVSGGDLESVEEKLRWELGMVLNGVSPWTTRIPTFKRTGAEVLESTPDVVCLALIYDWGEHGWGAFVGDGEVEEHGSVSVEVTYHRGRSTWSLIKIEM